MKSSRLLVALVAISLTLGVAAAPAAAADPGSSIKAKAAQSKKLVNKRIASARKRITTAERRIRATNRAIAALRTLATGADGKASTVIAAAPAIIDGLVQLRDGSLQLKAGLERAGAGLVALEKGLRDLAAGTTAGFDTVRTSLGSIEYGIAQVVVGATPQGGSFVVTPDISDAVQQAQTHQRFVAQTAGDINILYGVRSGESDGTGAGNPAANCRVTVTNATTPDGVGSTAPNAAFGGLPFQPVPNKSALTSTAPANAGFPFGLKTSGADADQTVTLPTTVTVAVGDVYTVALSCVDTTASSTDPSA